MTCVKCDGYLERDHGYEYIIQSRPAYRCLNCGTYYDLCTIRNKSLTQEHLDATLFKSLTRPPRRPTAYRVARDGRVVLR